MSIFGRVGQVWELAKTVERLLTLERKHGEAIAELRQEVDTLSRRIDRLDDRVAGLADEAKAAARAGAQEAMAGIVFDMGRRIGALENSVSVPKRITRRTKKPDS